MYKAALINAERLGLSSKLTYKWAIERCTEKAAIKDKLMEKLPKGLDVGLVDGQFITVDWRSASKVVPTNIMSAAKAKIPSDMYSWSAVKYDTVTQDCEFMCIVDFQTAPEPTIGASVKVTKLGAIMRFGAPILPTILLNKWALVEDNGFNKMLDRTAWLRRAINVEYLGIPDALVYRAKQKSFFEKHIAPKVGNRHIGKSRKVLLGLLPA
jgi:hypothetical protein